MLLQESKKRSLSLSNVAGVFYILVSGLVIAIVLGLIEVYIYKRQKSKVGVSNRRVSVVMFRITFSD